MNPRGVQWIGNWLVDWDRGRAYQPMQEADGRGIGQYLEFSRETGSSRILSERELPYYILAEFVRN